MTNDRLRKDETLAHLLAMAIKLEPLLFEEVYQLLVTDELTGAFNINFLNANLINELNRAKVLGYPLGVFIVHIDEHQLGSDEIETPVGFEILKMAVKILKDNLRVTDWVARREIAEFIIAIPGCSIEQQKEIGKTLHHKLSTAKYKLQDGKEVAVRVSIGGISFSENEIEVEKLIKKADKALFEAREAGDGRVVVHPINVS